MACPLGYNDEGYNSDDDAQQLEDDMRDDKIEEAAGGVVIEREVQLIDGGETEPLGGAFYFSFWILIPISCNAV